jgi:hypothetical protein
MIARSNPADVSAKKGIEKRYLFPASNHAHFPKVIADPYENRWRIE